MPEIVPQRFRCGKSYESCSMEISTEIVVAGISDIKKQYEKIAKLFQTGKIPDCQPIKDTIANFEKIKPRRTGEFPNLKSEYSLEKYYHNKKCHAIYIFSVTGFPFTKDTVERIKEDKKEISLCRINKNSEEWKKVKRNKSVCLYVGSSENIAQRLKEHLFLCSQSTYAMHLRAWFPTNLAITVNIWDFHDFLIDEDPDDLQRIEDILWNHYQPLFGRQGKK